MKTWIRELRAQISAASPPGAKFIPAHLHHEGRLEVNSWTFSTAVHQTNTLTARIIERSAAAAHLRSMVLAAPSTPVKKMPQGT